MGMGEGFSRPPLGPGFYFTTSERVAKGYCKYASRPAFTEVLIDTKNMSTNTEHKPHLDASWDRIRNEREELGLRQYQDLVDFWERKARADGMSYHEAKIYGQNAAREQYVDAGITGRIGEYGFGLEIAIFDPTTVEVIKRTPVEKTKQ